MRAADLEKGSSISPVSALCYHSKPFDDRHLFCKTASSLFCHGNFTKTLNQVSPSPLLAMQKNTALRVLSSLRNVDHSHLLTLSLFLQTMHIHSHSSLPRLPTHFNAYAMPIPSSSIEYGTYAASMSHPSLTCRFGATWPEKG